MNIAERANFSQLSLNASSGYLECAVTEDRNKTSDSFLKNENHTSLAVLLQRASRLMAKQLYNIQNALAAEDRGPDNLGCSLCAGVKCPQLRYTAAKSSGRCWCQAVLEYHSILPPIVAVTKCEFALQFWRGVFVNFSCLSFSP